MKITLFTMPVIRSSVINALMLLSKHISQPLIIDGYHMLHSIHHIFCLESKLVPLNRTLECWAEGKIYDILRKVPINYEIIIKFENEIYS